MREMRLKKREITDPEILREILESCEVVRIGPPSGEQKPAFGQVFFYFFVFQADKPCPGASLNCQVQYLQ